MLLEQDTRIQLLENGTLGLRKFKLALLIERSAFYGLLATILLSAIPYGTVEPWSKSLFVFLVCVLATLRASEGLISGKWGMREVGLLAPIVGLLLLATIQIIPFKMVMSGGEGFSVESWRTISADPFETRSFIFTLAALILCGELLLRYTNSEQRLSALIYLVLGVGLTSALFGLARQLSHGSLDNILSSYLGPDVGYAQFINRNHFAYLMEMTFGLLLGLIIKRGIAQRSKPLYYAMVAVVWIALVSCNSRGGILSMIGILLFAFLLHLLTRGRDREREAKVSSSGSSVVSYLKSALAAIVIASFILSTTVFAVAFIGGDPVVGHLETVQGELRDDSSKDMQRGDIWRSTWELIKANPVAGIGFGGYWTAITKYDRTSGEWSLQQAHNDYLEILASGGVLASALLLIFSVVLIRRIRGELNSKSRFRRASCFGASAGIFGVALHSAVDFGVHIIVNALVLTVLVVLASARVPVGDDA